jgi:hypothetical protein
LIVSETTAITSLPGLANNFDEKKKQHFAETLSAPHTLGANGPKTSTFSQRIVRAEESALGVSLNDQALAPDIPTGNGFGKPTRFRAPDFTESLNDLFVHGDLLQSHFAPAAGSSPRRPTSVPSSYFDDTLAKLVGKWFRQIIPLGIRHTFSLGTNDIPLLRAPRVSHILGAPGPKPQAVPQLFARAEESALGVSLNSFNAQSQRNGFATTVAGLACDCADYGHSLPGQRSI